MKKKTKKFYKKEKPKEQQPKKLPHNYRIISDLSVFSSHFRHIISGSRVQFSLILGLIFTFLLFLFLNGILLITYQKNKTSRVEKQQELYKIEKVLSEHPTSAQTYYLAAVLALELKDARKARDYVQQALFVDPNFEAAKRLEVYVKN